MGRSRWMVVVAVVAVVTGACESGGGGAPDVAAAPCGNGVREGVEACDGADFGDATCETLGRGTGALTCRADCTLDTAGCVAAVTCTPACDATCEECREGACVSLCGTGETCEAGTCRAPGCGDGVLGDDEECDGAEMGGVTRCSDLGLAGGAIRCDATCRWVLDACDAPPTCGNGRIEAGELCDSGDLSGASCESLGYGPGTLACGAACQYDATGCAPAAPCGDGRRDDDEECEGAELGGATCLSRGFTGGSLACDATCHFDTAGCLADVACDPACDAAACEACEDGRCVPTCALPSVCLAGSCQAPPTCGDGVVNGDEDCDGDDLVGSDCASYGYFDAGPLACHADCTYDRSACYATCGTSVDCPPGFECETGRCVMHCTDDAYEPSDTAVQAADLAPGAYELALCDADYSHKDWYRIRVPGDHTVAIEVHPLLPGLAFYVNFLNAGLGSIGRVCCERGRETNSAYVHEDADVYVQVAMDRGAGPYRLTVALDPPCVDDADCPAAGDICLGLVCTAGCRDDGDCPGDARCELAACVAR